MEHVQHQGRLESAALSPPAPSRFLTSHLRPPSFSATHIPLSHSSTPQDTCLACSLACWLPFFSHKHTRSLSPLILPPFNLSPYIHHHRLCHCNSGCAAATRAVPLQQGLRSCNMGCTVATRAVQLQHRLFRCSTNCDELYHCNTGCAATTRAEPLQHGLCQCNIGCAAATRAVPLQHGL